MGRRRWTPREESIHGVRRLASSVRTARELKIWVPDCRRRGRRVRGKSLREASAASH
jgi:hypothetical protein